MSAPPYLTRRVSVIVALYALLAVLVIPVFPHFTSPNELSRWVTAVALVDHDTIDVSRVLVRTGLRNIEDLSSVGGAVYSNKAPAATLLAVPAYAAARSVTGSGSSATLRPTLTAMRLAAATAPVILLALLVAAVGRRQGCEEGRLGFAVAALLFGTPLFAYGLLYFAHALSALLLVAVWALLFVEPSPRRDVAAGALVGLAVLTEYPNATAAAVLLVCALPRLRLGGSVRVFAGGAPFAIFLALYNRLLFGRFFTLSSGHESNAAFREMAESGLFGVGLPSLANLAALCFDPSKGLFVFSPVLLFALGGIRPARRAMPRAAWIALLAAPATIILTIAGYPNWHGGWTVGARYLVPALPFLALLLAHARRSIAEAIALGASVVAVCTVSLVFPFVPPDYAAPWISFAWPILQDGYVAPNLLHLVSRAAAVAVPFLIVTAAVIISVRRARLLAGVLGAVIWIAAGAMLTRADGGRPRAVRALVKEAYFGHEGAIREMLPPGAGSARLEAMARSLRGSPPPPWPF